MPDDSGLSPEVKGRLLRGLDCLRRLEHIWPRRSSLDPERAGSVSDGKAPVAFASGSFGTLDLPDYEILGELGRGGMGVVYKARQIGLNRLVALKMIPAGTGASPQTRARFHTEAVAAGRLQHPHIVQIHDIGEHRGQPYFSLELVEGGTLYQKLAGQPQPVGDAVRLIETLARAVYHAHQHGIIHRDLKPTNILLSADGTPKISDFGLAKSLEDDSNQTRTGTIVGTPSYMAPEQASGSLSAVGPAADIYALGVILYEMLTGRPPFCAQTSLETLELVRTQEPVSPRRLQPATPRDLETICLQCLAKEPSKRYASALNLADDLARFLAGRPIHARRTGMWERTVKWVKRWPAVAALAATVLLALVVGIVATTWQALRALSEADRNRRLLYSADVHLASQAWQGEEGNISQCLELLLASSGAKDTLVLLYRARQEEPTVLHNEEGVSESDFIRYQGTLSPDGKLAAVGNAGNAIELYDTTTGTRQRWMRSRSTPIRLTFSPDGNQLAVGERTGLVTIWRLPRPLLPAGQPATALEPMQTADGQRLARNLKGHQAAIEALAFTADGRKLISIGRDNTARYWDVGDQEVSRVVQKGRGQIDALSYSPDGRYLVESSMSDGDSRA